MWGIVEMKVGKVFVKSLHFVFKLMGKSKNLSFRSWLQIIFCKNISYKNVYSIIDPDGDFEISVNQFWDRVYRESLINIFFFCI